MRHIGGGYCNPDLLFFCKGSCFLLCEPCKLWHFDHPGLNGQRNFSRLSAVCLGIDLCLSRIFCLDFPSGINIGYVRVSGLVADASVSFYFNLSAGVFRYLIFRFGNGNLFVWLLA